MSGNGVRIFARYLWDRRLPARPDFAIHTPAGLIGARVLDARARASRWRWGGSRLMRGMSSWKSQGKCSTRVAVNIGNPHCVIFLSEQAGAWGDAPTEALARRLGPQIETHPYFPNRTNVQFAQVVDRHTLRIEIWERGAGYTLASGTSSCAAAGAAIRQGYCASPVTVQMPGGELLVEVDDDGAVRLTGPVAFVCRGEVVAGPTGIRLTGIRLTQRHGGAERDSNT